MSLPRVVFVPRKSLPNGIIQSAEILLDGKPLPWYVRDKPTVEFDCDTGIYTLHVAIMCDAVSTDLTLNAEAQAAIDALPVEPS